MMPLTKKWIAIGEDDWVVAQREARARKKISYRAICFHSQQCAEKYLKARLCEDSIAFKKTHDLDSLLKLVLPLEPNWKVLRADLKYLSGFSVDIRYPDATATKTDARRAIKSCRNVRKVIRTSFGLPV
jgi:HEPN domain-containing protein